MSSEHRAIDVSGVAVFGSLVMISSQRIFSLLRSINGPPRRGPRLGEATTNPCARRADAIRLRTRRAAVARVSWSSVQRSRRGDRWGGEEERSALGVEPRRAFAGHLIVPVHRPPLRLEH